VLTSANGKTQGTGPTVEAERLILSLQKQPSDERRSCLQSSSDPSPEVLQDGRCNFERGNDVFRVDWVISPKRSIELPTEPELGRYVVLNTISDRPVDHESILDQKGVYAMVGECDVEDERSVDSHASAQGGANQDADPRR